MDTTQKKSDNDLLKAVLPYKIKVLAWLTDKGLTFAVMGACMWVMYNWVDQSRVERMEQVKEQNEQIKDLRRIVDDCASAKKDQLELEVQAIHSKVDRILIHQNIQ